MNYLQNTTRGVEKALLSLKGDFDILISISYPAAIHRAVMKALTGNPHLTARLKLAEFSDPPLRGEYNPNFFPAYHRFLHRMARTFDYFIIPVENAVKCYTRYMPRERIKIIPQGFDMTVVKTGEYRPNPVPTFGYAGRFYRKTRDPKMFFDYLATLDMPFRFDLYLTESDPYFTEMLDKLKNGAKGAVVVHDPVPRNELIRKLSAADFIVNIDFTYSTATPSKLIDYALTGRPVISFNSLNFNPGAFDRFLNGDYDNAQALPDPSNYDIRNVAGQFLNIRKND